MSKSLYVALGHAVEHRGADPDPVELVTGTGGGDMVGAPCSEAVTEG